MTQANNFMQLPSAGENASWLVYKDLTTLNPSFSSNMAAYMAGYMAGNWSSLFTRNGSASGWSSPPSHLLESFIPGYRTLVTISDQFLGIDISLVLTGCAIIFAATRLWTFIQQQAYILARATILSEITFDSDDEVYAWLMEWIKKQPQAGRNFIAKAGSTQVNARHPNRNAKLREPPEISYEPPMGTHYFWFNRRRFRFSQRASRGREELMWMQPGRKHVEASLSTIARSAEPIRRLLNEAAFQHFEMMSSKTPIYRPYQRTVRQSGRGSWLEVTSRPSRSMDTVVFDSEQKKRILDDIDEYLDPVTMAWYASHGIPYRRGYLFFGPPGTGKSSLCFALAGHFKLPLYCVSLQEPSMTEEDLAALFDNLPRQCIAVIEDIDCAGLTVRDASENPDGKKSGPVSLSGLLNILDGLASKEGRILIMTTNRVEVLDAALIRPGRIDLRLEFKMASQQDAQSLFDNMYDEKDSLQGVEFAQQIPDYLLSAAEIQGFLLVRKGKPSLAIEDSSQLVKEALLARNRAKENDEEIIKETETVSAKDSNTDQETNHENQTNGDQTSKVENSEQVGEETKKLRRGTRRTLK